MLIITESKNSDDTTYDLLVFLPTFFPFFFLLDLNLSGTHKALVHYTSVFIPTVVSVYVVGEGPCESSSGLNSSLLPHVNLEPLIEWSVVSQPECWP